MTQPLPDDAARVLEGYRARLLALAADAAAPDAGVDRLGNDELLLPGGVRPSSADLAASVDVLGAAGLLTRRAQARRLLEDEGVTYGGGAGSPARRWALDPLPVVLDAQEWGQLEAGLAQRARVLDALLADLYGERRTLREGIVPPEVVFGHAGFVRQADGIRVPGARQLFLTATDLARTPHGWTVLGDRTQAPSGAGYAMENRRVVSRVLPGLYRDTSLARLRGFFHTMRAALQEVAPATAEAPRVVLLTPGQASETSFDQAFLATLLGYPLVEGGDLTVREGRVHLRALDRLEPVDVILRRVDAAFADPLELRPDSRLGVPGLIEAARAGRVSVVNTVGSGVLENPGLLPFLDAAARALLDVDPILPSVPTYWCGDAAQRSHVLARLPSLVVKPIARQVGPMSLFGWELTASRLEDLRRRIEAQPWGWCAQEPLEMSTAPVVTSAGLQPRRMVLRGFAVATGGGYEVMAGGLGRVAGRADSHLVSNLAGALAKDVWVLSPEPDAAGRDGDLVLPGRQALRGNADPLAEAIPPRVAEDLFWLGRYAERAEEAARLLRVVDDLAEDYTSDPDSPGAQALHVVLAALTRITGTGPGFVGEGAAPLLAAPHAELHALVTDATRPGTLAYAAERTVALAQAQREQLSLDTWVVLGQLQRTLESARSGGDDGLPAGVDLPLRPVLARIMESLLALAGLASESMVRDTGWHFLDAGRRVERALHVLALVRHTLAAERPPAVESVLVEAVLVAGESVITHRRRHAGGAPGGAALAPVLELLLLDAANPRAVAWQLARLADDLRKLPLGPEGAAALPAALRDLGARLREVDCAELTTAGVDGARPQLTGVLAGLEAGLAAFALDLERVHFVHQAPPRTLGAVQPPQPVPATGWAAP